MPLSLPDFHRYAFSDCLDNVVRGRLGEFLVASALGITDNPPYSSWESFDLSYMGRGIEVKTSAYVQTWHQKKETSPSFGIPKKRGWIAETDSRDKVAKRHADLYVFCLYTETDPSQARDRVLDTGYWEFYVVPTLSLPDQKTLSLSTLRRLTTPIPYDQVKAAIDEFIRAKSSGMVL